MKKLLFIISIMFLSLTLFSCVESSNNSIDRLLDSIDVIYAQGDDINSVTTHVTLPRSTNLNQSAKLTWSSDKPLIIDNFGTFNQPDETTEVTLTLTLTLNEESKQKTIIVTAIGIHHYFTVTFKTNNDIYESIKVKSGEKITPVEEPVIEGFGFRGWFISLDNENAFDFQTTVTQNLTLLAKLVVVEYADYSVELYYENLDDEAFTLESTKALRGEVGKEIDAYKVVTGFSLNSELSTSIGTITNDNSLVLKVYYQRNTYNVIFISDQVEISSVQYKFGETISAITDQEKDGYLFMGWSTNIAGTTPYDFSGTISDHMTFYAIWKLNDGFTYEGYYDGADGLIGLNLRSFLNTRVNTGTTMVNYGEARYVLDDTDRDPNNPNNLILIYLGTSVSGVWDGGATWNREHVWPQSLLGVSASNTAVNVASDLHNLKPANPSENTRRGNKFFDNTTTTVSYNPRNAVKGDVARILLHMDVAYSNLTLVSTNPSTYQMGKLSTLLQWHIQDPVDDFERNRNDVIYGIQKNRNPFIDHPEFVEKIWGPITMTASNNESFTIDLDFPSLFETIEIISIDILYIDFKKESKYLV